MFNLLYKFPKFSICIYCIFKITKILSRFSGRSLVVTDFWAFEYCSIYKNSFNDFAISSTVFQNYEKLILIFLEIHSHHWVLGFWIFFNLLYKFPKFSIVSTVFQNSKKVSRFSGRSLVITDFRAFEYCSIYFTNFQNFPFVLTVFQNYIKVSRFSRRSLVVTDFWAFECCPIYKKLYFKNFQKFPIVFTVFKNYKKN